MWPYLVGAAVVQLVVAIVVGGIADTKGRDGAIWFLVGLVIGPLALIPLLIFSKPSSPPASPPE